MHHSTCTTDPAVDPDLDLHRPSGVLWGIQLRYLLTVTLLDRGPMTVPELIDALERDGFTVQGRPSKTVSDALRWEIAHHRVVRVARGRYGPGAIPRSTRRWIDVRVRALREARRRDEPFDNGTHRPPIRP